MSNVSSGNELFQIKSVGVLYKCIHCCCDPNKKLMSKNGLEKECSLIIGDKQIDTLSSKNPIVDVSKIDRVRTYCKKMVVID